MSFNEQLPEWNATGVEPPASKKNEGWKPDDRPPADWFNWLFNRAYKVMQEIRIMLGGHVDAAAPHSGHETPAGATAKASAAETNAKSYTDNHAGSKTTHGIGEGYYIAKTSRSDQLPAYADVQDKPSSFPPSTHTHPKSEISDFPTSMPPSSHKSTHASGGSDALSPADIGAATAAQGETADTAASDLAAHLAETAQDNVHGLGDRPMVSSTAKTYYIDSVTGLDINDGLSAGTAFKTWAKARTMIPRFLSHWCVITIIGNLPEIIDVPPVFCKSGVYLQIKGSTTTASNHIVSGIKISACGGGTGGFGVGIYYLQSSGEINVDGANYVVIHSCNPRNSGGKGIYVRSSRVNITGCDFGTNVVEDAIYSHDNSMVLSNQNTGNATRYGLAADFSIIYKGTTGTPTQPTGTTANEYKVNGGQIF